MTKLGSIEYSKRSCDGRYNVWRLIKPTGYHIPFWWLIAVVSNPRAAVVHRKGN